MLQVVNKIGISNNARSPRSLHIASVARSGIVFENLIVLKPISFAICRSAEISLYGLLPDSRNLL
jgi:hypothetical protein